MALPATREQVMNALLTRLQTLGPGTFPTVTRHLDLVPDAPTPTVATPPLQPALYMFETHETTQSDGLGIPPIRSWFVELWIWCKCPQGGTLGVPDGVTPGATVINGLLEQIEGALQPDNMNTQEYTLGGLVYSLKIVGTTMKIPGDANPDGQCLASVPIRIIVP